MQISESLFQVNAVLGFCNMLWKLLKETKAGEKPKLSPEAIAMQQMMRGIHF